MEKMNRANDSPLHFVSKFLTGRKHMSPGTMTSCVGRLTDLGDPSTHCRDILQRMFEPKVQRQDGTYGRE